MVACVTPVLEQHMPRAQAHAGGQDAHVRFDFGAYLDSSTSTTQVANETLDQSHVAARERAGEYCCNQQFSITAITNSTGAISERYAYSAYGQPTILDASGSVLSSSAINNRYTYTGREWDATLGLHHFRARWMSPSAGRFLGRDPIGFRGSKWGLYGFLDGTPLEKKDPSGLIPIQCECNQYPPFSGGMGTVAPQKYTVTVNCTRLGENCCRQACNPNSFSGDWKVVEGPDAYDDAEKTFKYAMMEVQLCCLPTGTATGGFLMCIKGSARVLRTKLGHFILEYTLDGVTKHAHMPGWDWIGDNVSCQGVGKHLEQVVHSSPRFPIRYPEKIPETKCVRNCFWTVISCIKKGL